MIAAICSGAAAVRRPKAKRTTPTPASGTLSTAPRFSFLVNQLRHTAGVSYGNRH